MHTKIVSILAIVCIIVIVCTLVFNQKCQYKPNSYPEVNVKALTEHTTATIKAYEIPYGKFRGMIQPISNCGYFDIWNFEKSWASSQFRKEVFYHVPSEPEFPGTEEVVTDQWDITLHKKSFNLIYQATKKDGTISLQIELPYKKRDYTFYVLQNDNDQELIVFGDLSEFVEDNGIFGYVFVYSD